MSISIAPVKFLGIQKGHASIPPMAFYNTWVSFGPFGAGTTVTRASLERAGFRIPAKAQQDEEKGWAEYYAGQELATKEA